MKPQSIVPTLAILVALAIVPLASRLVGLDYLLPTFTRMLVYGLAAVSLNLLVGYAGVFSFGHAAFVAIGAYLVAIASFYASKGASAFGDAMFWNQALVTWPLAILITAFAAFVVAVVCMKREGITLVMVTLSLGQMLYLLLVSLKAYGGDDGLSMYPRNSVGPISLEGDQSIYFAALVVLSVYLLIIHFVMRSRFGRIIEAVRINPTRTTALGFSVFWTKVICFVIAAVGAAAAGILIANVDEFVSPSIGNWTFTGQLLTMVVIGGAGTRFGPLIGAIFFTGVLQVASQYVEQTDLIIGAVLIVLVLFSPTGIAGLLIARRPPWLPKFS